MSEFVMGAKLELTDNFSSPMSAAAQASNAFSTDTNAVSQSVRGLSGNIGGITQSVNSFADTLENATTATENVVAPIEQATQGVNRWKASMQEFNRGTETLKTLPGTIKQIASQKLDGLQNSIISTRLQASGLLGGLQAVAHSKLDGVKSSFKEFRDTVTEGKSGLSGFATGLKNIGKISIANTVSTVKSLGDRVKDFAGTKLSGIINSFKQFKERATGGEKGVKGLWNATKSFARTSLTGIHNSIKKVGELAVAAGKQVTQQLGGAFTAVSKGVGIAVGAAATAVGALVVQSVKAFANYEQLTGGVETLFKGSAGLVQQYANNAFKTAGLSANAYMETVTSFSASLLQSVGGDTEKAARFADVAISDMADNANKMGTSMDMIQNSYQGFAKQNYTMLDNLKLGYGGTKEEMQRLLTDAGKLSGTKFDLSSYADIVTAIHTVQENMGITGTTAKEAEKTISGSAASMKAAWGNMLVSLTTGGESFDVCVDNLVASVKTFGDNIMPAVTKALTGVGKLVESLAPTIAKELPGLLNSVIPQLLSATTAIVGSLANALPGLVLSVAPALLSGVTTIFKNLMGIIKQNKQPLISLAVDIATSLVSFLIGAIPEIIIVGAEMLVGFVQGIAKQIPTIVPQAVKAIETLVNGLMSNLDSLIVAGLDIINGLILGIIQNLPLILGAAMKLIQSVVTGLVNNIQLIINCALNLVQALFTGLIQNIPLLLQGALQLIMSIVNGLVNNIQLIVDGALTLVNALVLGITQNLPAIIQAAVQVVIALAIGLIQAIPQLIAAVPQLVMGIIDTIMHTNWLKVGWDIVSGIGKGLFDGIKGLFNGGGKEGGQAIAEGTATGLNSNVGSVTAASQTTANAITTGLQPDFTAISGYGATATSGLATGLATGAETLNTTAATMGTDAMTNLSTSFTSAAPIAVAAAAQTGTETVTGLSTGITDSMGLATDASKNVVTGVTDTFSGIDLYSCGTNAMEGFNNGINAMRSTIMATANDIANSVKTTINSALDIHSPSRVLEESGEFTGEGLAVGITKMINRVKSAAQGLSDATVEPFATQTTTAGAISASGVTAAPPSKREGLKIAIENIILQDVGNKDPKALVAEILQMLYDALSGADEVLSAGEMGALLT
ncbi:MAG: hypothetical protein RSE04_06030 [Hydrogenoanaerobacterium sp.]